MLGHPGLSDGLGPREVSGESDLLQVLETALHRGVSPEMFTHSVLRAVLCPSPTLVTHAAHVHRGIRGASPAAGTSTCGV